MSGETNQLFRHSGEFHYFRIPVKLWERNIPALKNLKIDTISTYIPWVWHEYEDDVFDFHGVSHPQRNLLKFLNLCRKNGFKVVIRPGPYIYAEYTGLGVPLWLMHKHPDCLVVTEKGKKMDMVTYGHPTLMIYARRWYQKLAREIAEFFDDGTIIAVQIDNEAGQILAGEVFNKIDYNPYVIEKFRDWLKSKYSSIRVLNRDLKLNFSSFDEIIPPKGRVNIKQGKFWLLWFKFYQKFIIDYLRKLMEIAKEEGLAKARLILNDSIILMHPARTKDKYKLAPVGMDVYVKVFEKVDTTFDFPYSPTFYAKYTRYYSDKHNYPAFGSEVQCGVFNPYTRVSNESSWQLALSLIAHGISGINWYIIHDAIEVDGSPYAYNSVFDINGNTTERFKTIALIGEIMDHYKDLLINSTEIYEPVAYLHYEDYILNFLYSILDLAFFPRARNAFLGAVADSGWNYNFIDLEDATSEQLKQFKILILFSLGFLDEKNYRKLFDFVVNGGRLITYPYPLIYNDSFEISFHELYPIKPKKMRGYGEKTLYLKLAKWMSTWRLFEKSRYKHRGSDFVIRGFYISRKMIETIMQQSKEFELFNQTVKGYVKFNEFEIKKSSQIMPILLTVKQKPFGYVAKVGAGESIVLGTNLFFEYDTPFYYSVLDTKDKIRNRELLELIFKCSGRLISDPPLETVVRKYKDTIALFVFNRGPKQKVRISGIQNVITREQIKIIDTISLHSSNITVSDNNNISIDIAENDTAVVLIE